VAEDLPLLSKVYNKIFDQPTTNSKKEKKDTTHIIGLEPHEREEGEVIILTLIIKGLKLKASPSFVEFVLERILVWADSGYDEYFLNLF